MKPNDRRDALRAEAEAADARTLVLSVPPLDPERLERFFAYQRSLLAQRAEAPKGLHEADQHRLEADAHLAAQQQSGLSLQQIEQYAAVARDVAGRLWTYGELMRRERELRAEADAAKASGSAPSPRTLEKLSRLDEERRKLDPMPSLELRWGRDVVALLRSREDELISLHRQIFTRALP